MNVIEIKESYMKDMLEAFSNVRKDETGKRWFVSVMWWDATEKALVATNGCSLLYYRNESYAKMFGEESGAYTYQKGFLIRDDVLSKETYVAYKKVIPSELSKMNCWHLKKLNVSKKYYVLSLMSQISAHSGCVFNPELFENVKKIADQFCSAYYKSADSAVVLTDVTENLKMVIMPMYVGY